MGTSLKRVIAHTVTYPSATVCLYPRQAYPLKVDTGQFNPIPDRRKLESMLIKATFNYINQTGGYGVTYLNLFDLSTTLDLGHQFGSN